MMKYWSTSKVDLINMKTRFNKYFIGKSKSGLRENALRNNSGYTIWTYELKW